MEITGVMIGIEIVVSEAQRTRTWRVEAKTLPRSLAKKESGEFLNYDSL